MFMAIALSLTLLHGGLSYTTTHQVIPFEKIPERRRSIMPS